MSNVTKEDMVREFFCTGCVAGSDLECGEYKEARGGCDGWVPGTMLMPGGNIALGFPSGFNKIPFASYQRHGHGKFTDRLHSICLTAEDVSYCVGEKPFNRVVWWAVKGDFTFLKLFRPRLNLVEIAVTPLTPSQIRDLKIELHPDDDVTDLEMG